MRFKPKKRLGQNFLIDKNIRKKILDSLELKRDDRVLEIGAGRGELTLCVAEKVKKVFAVEIDEQLCLVLKEVVRRQPNIKLIHQDILKVDLRKALGKLSPVKVFGNIPYYISSPIIEYLLGYREKIDSIFLTVQKEFAERMVAGPGNKDYSSFSCFVQYYADCRKLFTIKKGSFFPVPQVDSAFVRLKIRPRLALEVRDEELLFKIIRAAFNQRRKTLRNSLSKIVPADALERFFKLRRMDRNVRPENLTLEDFAHLTKII